MATISSIRASSAARATSGSALRLHLLVGLAFLLVTVAALGTSLLLLTAAAAEPGRSGRFTVLFPQRWSEGAKLAALLRADVVPVRQSWLGGAFEVEGTAPAVAARLEVEGATLVLPGLAFDLLALGGCSGATLADYPDRPAARKLRAGPL